MIAKFIQPGTRKDDPNDYLAITIANIGERPIRINGIAYEGYKWWWPPFKVNQWMVIPKHIPIYLKDGEEHTESYVYNLKQFKELLDNDIQVLYAYDSAGRSHRLSRWKMINFKRAIRKHLVKRKV